jgi:hypothetical protein
MTKERTTNKSPGKGPRKDEEKMRKETRLSRHRKVSNN